jgi:2-iminobutanoate/2-iminopropanoate deaminase
MKKAVIALALSATTVMAAQPVKKCPECEMALTRITTTNAPVPEGPYQQAVSVDLSHTKRLVFVSGQVAMDPVTGQLMEDDIQTATSQTMDNIEAILDAAGTGWCSVVRMDVFLRDMNDWEGMNAEYAKRFVNGAFPARQTVGVSMDNRIEMSCIAVVPMEDDEE